MEFNEDLAVVHAYLCADGYVIKNPKTQRHRYYKVGLRNTNPVLLKDFQERFGRIWGVEPILRDGERCEKGSKLVYEYLTTNFGSFYSWEWRMPKLGGHLDRAWLRTYFDCEGWVSIEKHKSRLVGVDSVNFTGLKQVKAALARNGIKSRLIKRNGKQIYRLFIYGKVNLIHFKKSIGFYHPQKSTKLEKALNDYIVYDWKFPNSERGLMEFIRVLMQKRAKVKADNGVVKVISNRRRNLTALKKNLKTVFFIESRINEAVNGIGTHYYQLNIYKKGEVKKAVEKNLLNKSEMEKWLRLRE